MSDLTMHEFLSGVRPYMCWLTHKGLRFIGEEVAT